jgi:hypothetical protein
MQTQLDLTRQPRGEDFPATRFLCDLERVRQGVLTLDAVRGKWAAGEYGAICRKWAADNVRWLGRK